MATQSTDLRSNFIMAKALVIAEQVLDAETDIRHREPSDLADMREMMKSPALATFVQVIKLIREE